MASFPNMAGKPDIDDALAAELEAAGIEVHRLSVLKNGKSEVDTEVIGGLHGWSFERAWYYWRCSGPGIEVAAAERLHAAHGKDVRVAGHCGCPSPTEWYKGLAVGAYHVDTPVGLKALADTIKRLVDRPSDHGKPDGAVRDRIARIIDPHSFMDIPFTDDPSLLDMVEQSKGDALRKADRILAALHSPKIAAAETSRERYVPIVGSNEYNGTVQTYCTTCDKLLSVTPDIDNTAPAVSVDAIKDIAVERKRQWHVEGWSPAHDDTHKNGELARAAASYALGDYRALVTTGGGSRPLRRQDTIGAKDIWPWDLDWWKLKDRRTNLVRAGALIVAEIERLDRAALIAGGR